MTASSLETRTQIPVVNASVLDRLTPDGLKAAPDKSCFSVYVYPDAVVDTMRRVADDTDDYSVKITGRPGDLVYTGVRASVNRSGNRKDHRGNVNWYSTSADSDHKLVTVPAGKLCVELSSSVNSEDGNFWKQVNSRLAEKTVSALPEGILSFQGRGDGPAYEAYALYVWHQQQKGEPVEPYGGRGDKGAIDGYVGYFIGEMQKRTPADKPQETKK